MKKIIFAAIAASIMVVCACVETRAQDSSDYKSDISFDGVENGTAFYTVQVTNPEGKVWTLAKSADENHSSIPLVWSVPFTEHLDNELLCIAVNNGCDEYPDPKSLVNAGYKITILCKGEGIIIENDEITHLGVCHNGTWTFTKNCPVLEMKKVQQTIATR